MRARTIYSIIPRIGRLQSGTGIYHVMLRGINRQDLFEEPDDYWTFIRVLSALQQRTSVSSSSPICACKPTVCQHITETDFVLDSPANHLDGEINLAHGVLIKTSMDGSAPTSTEKGAQTLLYEG